MGSGFTSFFDQTWLGLVQAYDALQYLKNLKPGDVPHGPRR